MENNSMQKKMQLLQRSLSYTYNFANDGRTNVEIFNDESSCVALFNFHLTHWLTDQLQHNGRRVLEYRTVGASKTCDQ